MNPKKKNTKEPETVQKRLSLVLRERSSESLKKKSNGFVNAKAVHIKQEFNFHTNSFYNDSNDGNPIEESTNSIDLMDISRCIMGIEGEESEYNDYENMNFKTENSASDEDNIEAIKKYLIEQPTEYIDLNSLQSTKHDYFNHF